MTMITPENIERWKNAIIKAKVNIRMNPPAYQDPISNDDAMDALDELHALVYGLQDLSRCAALAEQLKASRKADEAKEEEEAEE